MKVKSLFAACLLLVTVTGCEKVILNKIPAADAGAAQTIQIPVNSVTLTGTGKDEDGTITGYLWSMFSGPNIPAIETPAAATTKVSGLIAGTYRFQLMVVDNDGATGLDTVSINVLPSVTKTLTLQPGPTEGQDSRPVATQGCTPGVPIDNIEDIASPDLEDMAVAAWTFNANGCSTGQYRSFFKFTGLSVVPQTATVLSAKLSLYGITTSLASPQGNSYYPGSPYNSFGTNECWLKRVTGSWNEATLTWNNQPAVTETNRVVIPASTSQWGYSVIDLDVTDLVKGMVNNANSNHGFAMMHQLEQYYRSVSFGSSDNVDPAKRPKLVVTYNE
jgi:hypothetical protein